MAIAFDASTQTSVSGGTTSLTWSHTCTGANRILMVGIWMDSTASDVVTGVTYGGVAMFRINTATISTFRQYIYGIIGPLQGANNVVVSFTGTQNIVAGSASYTGAGGFGANNTATAGVGSTSISAAVTTGTAASWLTAQYGNNGGTSSAGSNSFQRQTEGSTNRCIYDTNGPDAAGSNAINVNVTATPQNSILNVVEITPAPKLLFGDAVKGRIGQFLGNRPTIAGYWQLDRSSTDYSGNGNYGTDTAVVYGQPGKIGQSTLFNASASEQIFLSASTTLDVATGPFTIAMWVYFNGLPISGKQWWLFWKGTTTGASPGYCFNVLNSSGTYQFNLSKFGITDQTVNWPGAATGQWFHLVAVQHFSGTPTTVSFYVNGQLVGNTASNTSAYGNTAGSPAYIGGLPTYVGATFLNAYVQDVIVLSEELPQNILMQYYAWATRKKKFFSRAFSSAISYVLTAAYGAFTLTGESASSIRHYVMAAAQGAYTLTGEAAGFIAQYVLSAAYGAFSLLGQAASLLKTGWAHDTKHSTSWSQDSKHSTSWTEDTKHSTSWTPDDKHLTGQL